MNEFFSKLTRFAVSKVAAFCYAVAVGLAGNLAFNFVQQHNHPPPPIVGAADPVLSTAAPALPSHAAATAAIPAETPKSSLHPPAANRTTASVEVPMTPTAPLPIPPAFALPTPDSLPSPALQPSALPPPEVPAHQEAAKPPSQPAPTTAQTLTVHEPTAPTTAQTLALHEPPTAQPPAPTNASPPTNAVASSSTAAVPAPLPPLGPAVDVSVNPAPPAEAAKEASPASLPATAVLRPARHAPPPPAAKPWELSDIWHPGRVVRKGLHWAGDQLPAAGKPPAFPQFGPPPANSAAARPATATSPAPISLLPTANAAPATEKTDAVVSRPKPSAPGPGSGGLY